MIIYNLIKKGYGSYNDLVNLPINIILDMFNYETFISDYESVYSYLIMEKK